MRPVVIVALIIAVSALTAQTLRHAYLRWLQNPDSVLEKYNPTFKDKIKNAESLEALEKEYAKAREKVKKADEENKKSKRKVNRYHSEPYKSERELKTAINKWERRSEEIRKTWFFWFGFSFIVAGLTQMIWWVSPSFSYNEASVEYQRMLENKFFLSLVTLIFVILLWMLFNKQRMRKEAKT